MNLLNFKDYKQYLHIVTKLGKKIVFKSNIYQDKLDEIVAKLIDEGRPVRIIVLKARQVGISTWGSAFVYWWTATRFFVKTVIIAHDSDSTNNLFNMCKRYYDSCIEIVRPMKRYSNAKELTFENPNENERPDNPGLESRISVETANKLTAGRSGTTQCLHISELAFWKNASTVLTGLMQSVPFEEGTAILIESTANGMVGDGEEFYERWCKADKGESDFIPVFFPWFWNPEYEMRVPKGFEITLKEQEIIETYLKSYPQKQRLRKLAWRRYKIANEMGSARLSPEEQFRQEYPASCEEAFLSSGRPVFNAERLQKDIDRARNIKFKRGYFDNDGKFIESERGNYKLFSEPNKQGFVIGADVAEGLADGDDSTMFVMGTDYKQYATYCGTVDADLFSFEIMKTGRAFNNALLTWEVNNHGHVVSSKIKESQYFPLYMRTVEDKITKEYTQKPGWQTSTKSKWLMLDEFVAAYRDGQIEIRDIDLLKEMLTLAIEDNGDVVLNGKDKVVSACIALQGIKQCHFGYNESFDPGPKKLKAKDKKDDMLEKLLAMDSENGDGCQFD